MALVLFEERTPTVGLVTLNDPDNLNAMGEDMAKEFHELVDRLKPDAEKYRAVILTGAGRAFSAGGNLNMLEKKAELSAEENHRRMMKFYTSFLSIASLEVPIIAAINGHAIGAGLCVASACDVRIVAENAKLGFTFAKLGLHPGMGATYFLERVVGYPKALELMITGRVVSASEAYGMGLASSVHEDGDACMTAALAIADEISTCGPLAVRQLLASMRTRAGSLEAALDREASCQAVNYASDEFKEGVRAAIEKRKPSF